MKIGVKHSSHRSADLQVGVFPSGLIAPTWRSALRSAAVLRNGAMCALLVATFSLAVEAEAADPSYFGVRPGVLAQVKARLQGGDAALQPALKQLLEEADEALQTPPPSVMQKTKLPPSGNKHDYTSIAPYFWPDPASSNGLPYIRHDGKVNPESRNDASDHPHLVQMAETVETLGLAYYFTGKEAYAEQAAKWLRTWFLDPATRMNPHLDFAQAVLGVNTGRGIGVIEGRNLPAAADAARLLAGSPAWTPKDNAALQAWLETYLNWLLTSKNGREEAAARNNHGTLYDVQAIRLALVLGKTDLAKRIAEEAKQKRIAVQIEPDGRQPLELERVSSFGYSRFNLEALFELSTLAEHVGVDLWHYRTADGRSMKRALDFLLPYIDVLPKPWPYGQSRTRDPTGFAPILRQAAIIYQEPKYEAILRKYSGLEEKRMQLLYPSTSAALK